MYNAGLKYNGWKYAGLKYELMYAGLKFVKFGLKFEPTEDGPTEDGRVEPMHNCFWKLWREFDEHCSNVDQIW